MEALADAILMDLRVLFNGPQKHATDYLFGTGIRSASAANTTRAGTGAGEAGL